MLCVGSVNFQMILCKSRRRLTKHGRRPGGPFTIAGSIEGRCRLESPFMFKKILIANRGEIAVRIIRACHEMGIAVVAVYSDVDRASLHVRKADEAYPIGPAAASESYLNIRKFSTSPRIGADAIHPGYGFLSENAKFARACADAGVKFIGPTAAAMDAMGSKTRARQAMEQPGYPSCPAPSWSRVVRAGRARSPREIGYPVMLKAAAGGGGKGMRLVHAPAELKSSLRWRAQRGGAIVRRQRSLYREGHRQSPPHRNAGLADEHGNAYTSANASVPCSGGTRR